MEGDYLEFGVYSGNSFTQSFLTLEKNRRDLGYIAMQLEHEPYEYPKRDMRYFAFDSFEGFRRLKGPI